MHTSATFLFPVYYMMNRKTFSVHVYAIVRAAAQSDVSEPHQGQGFLPGPYLLKKYECLACCF